MLDHGVGVNEDGDQSLQLYKLAVGAGYMQSANNVGIYYLNGKHVVPDAVLAEEWLTRGKQSGDEIAAKNLMKLKELQSSRAVGSSSSDFRKYAKIWLESPFLF